FTKNRIVEFAVLEGYDAPECVDASFTVTVNPSSAKPTRKITGRIRVFTYGLNKEAAVDGGGGYTFNDFFPTDKKYPFWQPNINNLRGGIFHDISRTTNNFPYFGGGSFNASLAYDQRAGMEDTYDQRIPMGGWPVYVVGRNISAVSKQISA